MTIQAQLTVIVADISGMSVSASSKLYREKISLIRSLINNNGIVNENRRVSVGSSAYSFIATFPTWIVVLNIYRLALLNVAAMIMVKVWILTRVPKCPQYGLRKDKSTQWYKLYREKKSLITSLVNTNGYGSEKERFIKSLINSNGYGSVAKQQRLPKPKSGALNDGSFEFSTSEKARHAKFSSKQRFRFIRSQAKKKHT